MSNECCCWCSLHTQYRSAAAAAVTRKVYACFIDRGSLIDDQAAVHVHSNCSVSQQQHQEHQASVLKHIQQAPKKAWSVLLDSQNVVKCSQWLQSRQLAKVHLHCSSSNCSPRSSAPQLDLSHSSSSSCRGVSTAMPSCLCPSNKIAAQTNRITFCH